MDNLMKDFENMYCDQNDAFAKKVINYDLQQLAILYMEIINNKSSMFIIPLNPFLEEQIESNNDKEIINKIHAFIISQNMNIMLENVIEEIYNIRIIEKDIVDQILCEYYMYMGFKYD